LKEVNVLNSKLMYLSKILKESNLSESQKVNVVTAFDKAGTVKEAKLVYETLSESLTEAPVKKIRKQLVRESRGFASKPTGTNTTTKKPVVEVDPAILRMKKLAGLL